MTRRFAVEAPEAPFAVDRIEPFPDPLEDGCKLGFEVSSAEKGEYAKSLGAVGYVNRKAFSHWGVPPAWDSAEWKDWFGGAKDFGEAFARLRSAS